MLKAVSTLGFRCGLVRSWLRPLTTSTVDWAGRIDAALTPAVQSTLKSRGFAVVDDVFGSVICDGLVREIDVVHEGKCMMPNATHLFHGGATELLIKSKILEMELELLVGEKAEGNATFRRVLPYLSGLNADRSMLKGLLTSGVAGPSLSSQAIKLQINEGDGASFPMHFDTAPGIDGRIVTAIYYMNENFVGGELKLYPVVAPPVVLEPRADRLVLFSSASMLHRVLPSHARRRCLTIWMSGKASPPVAASIHAGHVRRWLQPALFQFAAKALHAAEWRQSIVESHPESPQLQRALQRHDDDCAKIRNVMGVEAWDALQSVLPPSGQGETHGGEPPLATFFPG